MWNMRRYVAHHRRNYPLCRVESATVNKDASAAKPRLTPNPPVRQIIRAQDCGHSPR